jgi:cysteine desulfurase
VTHIYLDHNSTSIIDPAVVARMQTDWGCGYANPASQHGPGRAARAVLEATRRNLLRLLGASSQDRWVFTSGGTESNHLAIFGLCGPPGSNVVLSAIEHPSIADSADRLRRQGVEVRWLPASPEGVWQVERLPELLDKKTSLVCLMLANNETGVVQPVERAAEICRAAGARLHTDAVQAIGRIPLSFSDLAVDSLSIAAHKFHGPRGVGGLLVRAGVELRGVGDGGVQQYGWRPGTEDVVLPRGMELALSNACDGAAQRQDRLRAWREEFEGFLKDHVPGVSIIGERSPRLPQTICVSFAGVNRQALMMAADLEGLAISTGSACASGSSEPSRVLQAMGLAEGIVDSAVRISFGVFNTLDELRSAAARIGKIVGKIREKSPAGGSSQPSCFAAENGKIRVPKESF